jgi:hypothetical protein
MHAKSNSKLKDLRLVYASAAGSQRKKVKPNVAHVPRASLDIKRPTVTNASKKKDALDVASSVTNVIKSANNAVRKN